MAEQEPITLNDGQIQFYDYYRTTLPGGQYRIQVTQEVDFDAIADRKRPSLPSGQEEETVKTFTTERVFHVEAPHFQLGPEDVQAVYPPGNSVGDFERTLPHLVLRRRSLPWERELGPDEEPPIPWLGLLLFNGTDDGGGGVPARVLRPLSEVFDPREANVDGLRGRVIEGPLDDLANDKAYTIDVPGRLFDQIAPQLAELPLLSHVRQVKTGDKELLGLQEDGWFSVVVGNRLPQPGQRNTAHLVSFFGWQHHLPNGDPLPPIRKSGRIRGVVSEIGQDSWVVAGLRLPLAQNAAVEAAIVVGNAATVTADVLGNGRWQASRIERLSGSDRTFDFNGPADNLTPDRLKVAGVAIILDDDTSLPSGLNRGDIVRVRGQIQADNSFLASSISLVSRERLLRLVSLASWSFTALELGRGNFKDLMGDLADKSDTLRVNLSQSQRQAVRQAPAAAEGADTLLTALDSGYVPLNYETRHGEKTAGWYRGPFLPHKVGRVDKDPYETAEAALIYDPLTGLFDVSYAVAWQIGRLLALADGDFSAAIQRWRQEGNRLMDQILEQQGLGDRFGGAHLFTALDRIEAANQLLADAPPNSDEFNERYEALQVLLQSFIEDIQDTTLLSERLFGEVMAGLLDRLLLTDDQTAAMATAPINKAQLAANLDPLSEDAQNKIGRLGLALRASSVVEELLPSQSEVNG